MHWGGRPRPFIADWFREDGLLGQNLNIVLTITTINSSYTILFLIRSQLNSYKSQTTYSKKYDIHKRIGEERAGAEGLVIVNCSKLLTRLKRAHLIFKFKQFEYAQVKGEWSRGVGRK
jgi:hypothetical protein